MNPYLIGLFTIVSILTIVFFISALKDMKTTARGFLMSLDNDDKTGFDSKKIAFFFVITFHISWLLLAYTVKEVHFDSYKPSITFKDTLPYATYMMLILCTFALSIVGIVATPQIIQAIKAFRGIKEEKQATDVKETAEKETPIQP